MGKTASHVFSGHASELLQTLKLWLCAKIHIK